MNTEAVMCIALQSTSPSTTPLLRTASSTCGVMFTNPTRAGNWNVRYSVWDFMARPRRGGRRRTNVVAGTRDSAATSFAFYGSTARRGGDGAIRRRTERVEPYSVKEFGPDV